MTLGCGGSKAGVEEMETQTDPMEKQPSTTSSQSVDDPWCMSTNPRVLQIEQIQDAKEKLEGGVIKTECSHSHLINVTGMDIYLKKEFLQYTGSFKERGARYALLMLDEDQKKIGVIAASTGNYSQALSYHGMLLQIPVTVVMPTVTPLIKITKCQKYKARVIIEGKNIADSKKLALQIAKETGLLYINGYDHPHVLAGQGTIGLEIVEQVPDLDAVIVPIGGGGLISGIAVAVKHLKPQTKIIGVESEKCPSFTVAMEKGKPTVVPYKRTITDGLTVPKVGWNALATVATLIDKLVLVPEELVSVALLHLMEQEKAVVEGAGATPLAAILTGKLNELKGKQVVLVLSGGNIDTNVLARSLERGLVVLGRLVKCSVVISDRPGGLAELTHLVAGKGVTIKDVSAERAWVSEDVFSARTTITCETRDIDHAIELKKLLESKYPSCQFTDFPNVCRAQTLGKL